ncbi:nuclear transport factor 2 family protein [uncultured Nonlabens sp.]|uniref:nuclear transport factor 2 family protein n=1 Tax=uncultured Nonlabens sp. TaxID=859306 RepID=UPI00260DB536|nr:nuclear transport factor 2 family protein [uncultured Nonlabens sp.]
MSAAAKKIVKGFLDSNVFVDPKEFGKFIHPDFVMHWHASSGYREFDYKDYLRLTEAVSSSYVSTRSEVSHLLSEKDEVVARFTVFVKTLENPQEELPVGYFISIFRLSENKILEVYQTSHNS